MARIVDLVASLLSLFFSLSLCSPILDPITNPYLENLASLLSGKGIVEGTLGAMGGAVGVEKTFDYVVVGGGTAGNAIGVRLAEAGASVAIVEAGGYYEIGKPVFGTTPAGGIVGIGASPLSSDPLVDWVFVTEPQAAMNDREVHYARGKCLGGTSGLNFMIYHRGSEKSYEQWAEAVGDESYTLESLQPYFEKAVNFTPPIEGKRFPNVTSEYDANDFTSPGGPVQVSYSNYVSPFSTWVEKALLDNGLEKNDGFNDGRLLGTHYVQTTMRASDQTRSSSAAYINSALDNENLHVYVNTLVKKVLFDSSKRASGVEVVSLGITYKINAAKEVILSAGAFQSPQILMVSGIGPKETLDKFDIEVLSDLPGVGQNMWDHIMFGPAYEVNMDTLDRVLHDPVVLAKALTDYTIKAEGVLTSNVGEFLGWEKLPEKYRANFSQSTIDALNKFPDDWPEVEFISGNGYIGTFNLPILQQPLDGKQYATILGGIVAPSSRGNVTISSASTSDHPLINPAWLSDPADQELAIALFRRIRDVWASDTMTPAVVGSADDEYWPGRGYESDEELLEIIKEAAISIWHAAGTCKMGTKDDQDGVIDSAARVFGVEGLRVVDAGSFPILPPGHPTATVYALAEKIAANITAGF